MGQYLLSILREGLINKLYVWNWRVCTFSFFTFIKLSQGFSHCSLSCPYFLYESLFQRFISSLSRFSLCRLWGLRHGLESAIGQTALENYMANAIHSLSEWVSGRAECRGKGEEEGETEKCPPVQLHLRRRWLTQHVIPLLSFRATIDPTTSSPLRVSIPARL